MSTLPQQLASEFSLRLAQVEAALELLAEGATIPFIARYRKERKPAVLYGIVFDVGRSDR